MRCWISLPLRKISLSLLARFLCSHFFFSICLLYSISTKEIESNTLDLCSSRGSCGSFVHVDLESNTLDLGFGANITHLI